LCLYFMGLNLSNLQIARELIPTRLKNHPFAGSDCCDPVWV
jgi:hypothetical protein